MIIDFGDIDRRTDGRATWKAGFLAMAKLLGELFGDCTRRKVGAVIFNPANGDLIQLGYNGAPAGEQGCLTGACPRGRHYKVHFTNGDWCACSNRWPCPDNVVPGANYETGPGKCIAIHAELNACLRAGTLARGMAIAISEEPCEWCVKLLRGARLALVVTPSGEHPLVVP